MRHDLSEDPRRAAFDAQATSTVLDKVYRAARARMHVYAGRTQHVNPADVDDMVMGVITDTLDGTLTWHHETKPLLQHLLDTVRYRVRDAARKRARDKTRYELVVDEDETDSSLGESMIAGGAPDQASETLAMREIADRLVADLRVRIAGDADVGRLLDAMIHEGAFERADIIAVTGMTPGQHDNARKRFNRILLQLPPEIRETALSAFTN